MLLFFYQTLSTSYSTQQAISAEGSLILRNLEAMGFFKNLGDLPATNIMRSCV